jgi:hypothetical protein
MQALCHVCNIVTRFNDLTAKYGFRRDERARFAGIITRLSKSDDDDDDTGNQVVTIPNLFSDDSRNTFESILQTYQKRISYMDKFTWAIKNKERYDDLVKQMWEMNNGLESSLPRLKQSMLGRELVAGQPSDILALRNIESIMAVPYRNTDYYSAAVLKRRTLEQTKQEMDFLETRKFVKTSLKSIELSARDFPPADQNAFRVLRVQAGKVQKKVLLEYKKVGAIGETSDQTMIITQRLFNLVNLLRITPKPSQYRILDCQGIVRHDTESEERYGLVFTLPSQLAIQSSLRFSSLQHLLRTEGQNTAPQHFPLEYRFELAARLANSIAYMHFAGWLHRNLTSESVVCFHSEDRQSIDEPFLSGFTFSRPDNPREVSEYDVDTTSNLYRHAEYQMPKPAQRFRRSFDLYSLGIILIEIGLWKQIRAFRKPGLDARAFREYLIKNIVPLLGFYMGDKYKDATMACLEIEKLGVRGDEDRKLSSAFSRIVVQQLESCQM